MDNNQKLVFHKKTFRPIIETIRARQSIISLDNRNSQRMKIMKIGKNSLGVSGVLLKSLRKSGFTLP